VALAHHLAQQVVHVHGVSYIKTIRACRRRIACQNPSLQSMTATAFHVFGRAFMTA
jgi:hypothetical protein